MANAKWAVMRIATFDLDVCDCVVFDDYEKAKAYLHWSWEDYYNTEIAENSGLYEEECYHEDEYAKVEWDDGEHTEFLLTVITPPDEEFHKVDWHRYV